MSEPLFLPEGRTFAPTASAGSPWSNASLHGGPVCGLLAAGAEALVSGLGLQPVRLTVDLHRPVPKAPLVIEPELVRKGRRLAVVQVRLTVDGAEAARATALFLAPTPAPVQAPESSVPAGPEGLERGHLMPPELHAYAPAGFHQHVEVCWVEREGNGNPAGWFRMPMAILPDASVTPFQRAAVLSDLTNALASVATRGRGVRTAYINPDSTLHLSRLPEGDWLCLELAHFDAHDGLGLVEAVQYDGKGCYGRSLQARLANEWTRGRAGA